MVQQKLNGVVGAERDKHIRSLDRAPDSQDSQRDKPEQHDRPKPFTQSSCPMRLDAEECEQHDDGNRERIGLIGGRLDGNAFHRAEDRDGRRDHPIPVDQRRAEQPECDHRADSQGKRRFFAMALPQGHQGQNPTFALVVGSHHEEQILHGDDQ